MVTLLEITVLILLAITVLTCIYCRYLSEVNDAIIDGMRELNAELEHLKAKQRINEKRFQKLAEPEKLIIEHEYRAGDAPKYGGF